MGSRVDAAGDARFRADLAQVRLARIAPGKELFTRALTEAGRRMTTLGMNRAEALESVCDDISAGRIR